MRHLAALIPLIALPTAYSSKSSSSDITFQEAPLTGGFLHQSQAGAPSAALYDDFAANSNAKRFIDKMANEHGFGRQELHNLLAQIQQLYLVLRLMERQAPAPVTQAPAGPNGPWLRYHKNSSPRTT